MQMALSMELDGMIANTTCHSDICMDACTCTMLHCAHWFWVCFCIISHKSWIALGPSWRMLSCLSTLESRLFWLHYSKFSHSMHTCGFCLVVDSTGSRACLNVFSTNGRSRSLPPLCNTVYYSRSEILYFWKTSDSKCIEIVVWKTNDSRKE